eukprot:TRINITY_DN4900_c1_g2_i1.p11 TRINITY_DN4900_c1_g2~~TRINITY_DN4900_c1_g2_i1.p11  ORF type:complete len:136 (+),score=4.06 TRINITY_DN4900_c1_g2_i1:1294-1701(+)
MLYIYTYMHYSFLSYNVVYACMCICLHIQHSKIRAQQKATLALLKKRGNFQKQSLKFFQIASASFFGCASTVGGNVCACTFVFLIFVSEKFNNIKKLKYRTNLNTKKILKNRSTKRFWKKGRGDRSCSPLRPPII